MHVPDVVRTVDIHPWFTSLTWAEEIEAMDWPRPFISIYENDVKSIHDKLWVAPRSYNEHGMSTRCKRNWIQYIKYRVFSNPVNYLIYTASCLWSDIVGGQVILWYSQKVGM